MNEVKNMIDNEIGKDTEHLRVTLSKYVGYGRRLEREEMTAAGVAQFTQADLDAAAKARAAVVAMEIFSELSVILQTAAVESERVEKDVEKSPFAALKAQAVDGPVKAAMLQQFETLLSNVDKAHTVVIQARNAEIEALKAKYLGQG